LGYEGEEILQRTSILILIQDAILKYSKTPLNDPNFDFQAWKKGHMETSHEIGVKWAKDVQSIYGKDPETKFACVGFW